jgi:tetratricopeptide (TPR) repeat protein
MRATVFTDPALARHAGRFVWLSIDTEREENAPFQERFPISAWPTLLVLDPATEKAALKWMGSATVPQLVKLLEDGERALKGAGQGLEARLAAADQAFAAGRMDEAAALASEVAGSAAPDWDRRPRSVELWVTALYFLGQHEQCAEVVRAQLGRLPRGPSYANAAVVGLSCALQAPAEAAGRQGLVAALEKAALEVLRARDIQMAADDYSGLYEAVVEARSDQKDEDGARALAREWAAYLEEQARRAPTPEARTVFDSHRLSAYLKLGEVERAIPFLQESEKALPDDFNPPARLAIVYRELGRYAEALAASDRALARARGPRRLRILSDRAEIYRRQGDLAAAGRTLDEAIAFAQALPRPQQSARALESLRKKRAELK